jgi:starch-binding outer membrane protein, SusD/RagB family
MMKNLINSKLILAGLAASLMTAACTDLTTIEKDSEVVVTSGDFKEGDPGKLLTSAYAKMDIYTDQANVYSLGQHTSGEMIPPTRGVDWGDNGVWRTLDQHTWDPTHSWMTNAWNQLNERSYNCNEILASKPSPAQAAEAKFIRAYHMHNVLDFWGKVPVRNVKDKTTDNPQVLEKAEAFAAIVKDLEEALADLSDPAPSATNSKATKAAANYLLAKMYLNKHIYTGAAKAEAADMDKVVNYCNAIQAAGYGLEDSYFTNFTAAASKEVILVSENGSPQNRWFMTLHYDQNPSGWNGFTTLSDFYAKFDAKDQRTGIPAKKDGTKFSGIGKGFLVGKQYKDDGSPLIDSRSQIQLEFTPNVILAGANTAMGYRAIKYHPADAGKYILMRNGAVHMMKAEAQHRAGKSADAAATLNALRAKRGMGAVASVTDDAIFDEWGRETYWEGSARTNEIRFGKFLNGTGVVKKDAGTVLFPIPAVALASNPNLRQNPGY